MSVERLDHYSIRTTDLETTSRFFVDVLGFEEGDRPPFTFPGVWLYCGGKPTVHLIGIEEGQQSGSGAVDHVAFSATGFDTFRARLSELGLAFRESQVPGLQRRQLFVDDPSGIKVELNFPAEAESGA